MPKYSYQCTLCDHIFSVYHSMGEDLSNCPECKSENSLKKDVSRVYIRKDFVRSDTNKKVGELTREAIEENREILKSQKEILKGVVYED